LWPEQFGLDVLEEIRRDPAVGEYIFSCQYLLDPVPDDEDAFFNLARFPEYEGHPGHYCTYAAIDFAITEEDVKTAAETAIVVVGLTEDHNIPILDVRHGLWSSDRICEEMIDVQVEYNPLLFIGEQGHINKAIGPFLRAMLKELGITMNLEPRTPVADKIARARTAQGMSKMGRLWLPKRGANQPKWLSALREQLRRFPYGRLKDIVDALSWITREIDYILKSKWAGIAS
jgi:predicted phage terminase large subunit-like protein